MERGEQPRAALAWAGIWVTTKTDRPSYPSDRSVVRFPFALVVFTPLGKFVPPSGLNGWDAHQSSQIFTETEAYFSLGGAVIGPNHRQNSSYTIV